MYSILQSTYVWYITEYICIVYYRVHMCSILQSINTFLTRS